MSIVDNRELSADWQTSISAARAWLLFIRLSTLKLREDLLTRPPGHVSKPYAAGTDNIDGSRLGRPSPLRRDTSEATLRR